MGNVDPQIQYEVEQFLYGEAELLDDQRFDEWLELMADDVHYWAPTRSNRLYRERRMATSPPGESAYFDDNREQLAQRVDRLYTRMAWAEDPPSRTRHLLGNVRTRTTDRADEFRVVSNFFVYRTRMERDRDSWIGKRDDLLRRADNPYGFQVARREILFDMSILLAKNISVFI